MEYSKKVDIQKIVRILAGLINALVICGCIV